MSAPADELLDALHKLEQKVEWLSRVVVLTAAVVSAVIANWIAVHWIPTSAEGGRVAGVFTFVIVGAMLVRKTKR